MAEYRKAVSKNLWIVALVVVIGLAIAAYYTLSRPPQYQSTATLLLNPALPSANAPYPQAAMAANLADIYTGYIATPAFGEALVKRLPFPVPDSDVAAVISTRLEPNTLLYRITATMPAPDQAQQIANAVANELVSTNGGQSAQNSDSPTSQMDKRLNDNLQSLDAQIKIYQQQIADLESQPPSTDRDNTLLQLRGQLITLQNSEATTLLALSQTADRSNAPGTSTLVEQALPGAPTSGELVRNLALAFIVSLLLGVGIALLVNYLGDGIDSPQRLREVTGTSPLATIGIVQEPKAKSGGSTTNGGEKSLAGKGLVALDRPHSLEAESFRVLRDNIRFASPDKPLHGVVVTSASRSDGRSFIAANLAVTMAQGGQRVTLVDADLRNPSLHDLFGLSNQAGFTNLILNGSSDLERAIQPVPGVDNLVVVTSGPVPANPPDLLASHLAERLVRDLAQVADIVLYDSPPAEDFPDPGILGAQAGDVLLVVRADSAHRDTVARVKQNLLKAGVTRVLPVLNRVKAANMQNYSYRYYGSSTHSATLVAKEPGPNGKAPAVVSPVKPRPAEEASAVLDPPGQ